MITFCSRPDVLVVTDGQVAYNYNLALNDVVSLMRRKGVKVHGAILPFRSPRGSDGYDFDYQLGFDEAVAELTGATIVDASDINGFQDIY